MKKRIVLFIALACTWGTSLWAQNWSRSQVEEYANTGKTLPVEVYAQCPEHGLKLKNDKGFNVLVDVAHACNFSMMWGVPPRLHSLGYRAHSSHATLNSVLDVNGVSRRRIPYDMAGKFRPFGWCPNLTYNTVVTYQTSPKEQPYTDAEIAALQQFVNDGGSLLVLVNPAKQEELKGWSMNKLLNCFGASVTGEAAFNNRKYATFKTPSSWETVQSADGAAPVYVRGTVGKGRVAIIGNASAFDMVGNKAPQQEKDKETAFIDETLAWLNSAQQPVGGYFPAGTAGGGDIYPELETNSRGIVIYYAANQFPYMLKCVQEECPKITDQIFSWYPSQPTKEPMYLLLCAGDGGGWAVNAFYPKENGIISMSTQGIISIFAHELAHTMQGPLNYKGETAGLAPIGNSGEAHAGWFQGKIDAIYDPSRLEHPNRKCGDIFHEKCFAELDFVKYYENKELHEKFGKGKDWHKTWYIWQRMDDTFGPTWYPRWKWVQHTRWAETPQHRLTWEEMVEDMSIAVGKDLFPFIKACGIGLNRDKIGAIEFNGKKQKLKPAQIEVIAPGKVHMDDIANYKQPIKVKK
ncbi:MAG: hypothetical protein ACRDDZ_09050 [Marinifilaceae bacterium]